jgi:hypothetical protein
MHILCVHQVLPQVYRDPSEFVPFRARILQIAASLFKCLSYALEG